MRRWVAVLLFLLAAFISEVAQLPYAQSAANMTGAVSPYAIIQVSSISNQGSQSQWQSNVSSPLPFYTANISGQGAQAAAPPYTPQIGSGFSNTVTGNGVAILQSFNGIDYLSSQCGCVPPDVEIAVDSNDVVEMTNGQMAVYSKAGTQISTAPLSSFWGTSNALTDPKIVFDAESDRWFASVADLGPSKSCPCAVRVAASTSNDPLGSWAEYFLTYNGSIPDQPILAVSGNFVALSVNLFNYTTQKYRGAQYTFLDKPEMIVGTTAATQSSALDTSYFSIHPAQNLAPSNTMYMASLDSGSVRTLYYFEDTGNVPTVSVSEYNVPISPDSEVNCGPVGVCNSSGGIDGRVLDAKWYNNILWVVATSECTPPGSASARACARVIGVNTVTRSVVDDFNLSQANTDFYYPAVSVDAANNIDFIWGFSNSTFYPSIAIASQPNSSIGTNRTTHYVTGYVGGANVSGGRYGDYFEAYPDPANPKDTWAAAEYIPNPSDPWATRIFEFQTYSNPAATLMPSNTIVVTGMPETYTITVSGGVGPFTAELYNITGNRQQGSNVIISSPGDSNTITFNAVVGGAFSYNAIVTDLGTSITFNSAENTIIVSAPNATEFTPSAFLLDFGQQVTYGVLISGGIGPFTANLVSSNGIVVNTISGTNNGLIDFGAFVPPIGTDIYNAMVVDLGTTPQFAFNSLSNSIQVNASLGVPAAPPLSSNTIGYGDAETLTSSEAGGTLPYSYNFIISNAIDNSIIAFSGPQVSNSFSYTAAQLGIFRANVVVTDSASVPVSENSVYSLTFNVVTSSVPTMPLPSNSVLDAGQFVVYNTIISGGVGPFTINLIAANGTTINTIYVSSPSTSPVTFNAFQPAIGSDTFNVVSYDAGTSLTSNSISSTILVNNALGVPIAPLVSLPALAPGNIITFNTLEIGGSVPYMYNFIISYSSNDLIIAYSMPQASNSFVYNTIQMGSFHANVMISDSASTPVLANSVYSSNFSVSTTTTTTTTSSTTTVQSGGGGGGGSGGGGGFSGGGGGGGSQKPIITQTINGYNITNIAQLSTFNITLCGQTFVVVDNYITPTYAGVTVNNVQYVLYPNVSVALGGGCYMGLGSISYIPILQTITMLFYKGNAPGPQQESINITAQQANPTINVSASSNVTINMRDLDSTFRISSNSSETLFVRIFNYTSNASRIQNPGAVLLLAISINVSGNTASKTGAAINATIRYPCGAEVTPYMLENNSWIAISKFALNASECTISFEIPMDPVVALFQNRTTTSTIQVSTTAQTTVASTSTVSALRNNAEPADYIASLIMIAVVVLALYELLHRYMSAKKRGMSKK